MVGARPPKLSDHSVCFREAALQFSDLSACKICFFRLLWAVSGCPIGKNLVELTKTQRVMAELQTFQLLFPS